MSSKRSQKELAYEFTRTSVPDQCHDVQQNAATPPSGKTPTRQKGGGPPTPAALAALRNLAIGGIQGRGAGGLGNGRCEVSELDEVVGDLAGRNCAGLVGDEGDVCSSVGGFAFAADNHLVAHVGLD